MQVLVTGDVRLVDAARYDWQCTLRSSDELQRESSKLL